jgi:hypothetical protein
MNLSLVSCVRRNASLLFADAGDELVMMNVDAGLYYSLDAIGRRIWELIETPARISEVCDRLLAQYDVTPEACRQQVTEFFDELAAQGIVEVVPH